VAAESGWEKAVERVLDTDLAAVCVDRLDDFAADVESLRKADLTLFETGGRAVPPRQCWPTLVSKPRAGADLAPLLSGVYVAETLAEAMAMRSELAPHESVVTRAGAWVGRNWIAVTDRESERAGVLGREREIEQLTREVAELDGQLRTAQTLLGETQQQIAASRTSAGAC
jgi:chromosome segregation protein